MQLKHGDAINLSPLVHGMVKTTSCPPAEAQGHKTVQSHCDTCEKYYANEFENVSTEI